MKNEQENKRDYYVLSLIIWGLCLIMACTDLFFNHCERSKTPPPNENTDLQIHNNAIQRRIITRKHQIEEAKQIVPKAQAKAQVYFDTVIVYMPDTCKPYLLSYKLFRDSTENLLLYVVASQDSTIKDQDTIIQNQLKMLINDSILIRDTVRYFDKAIRKRGFKRLTQGFLIGFGAGAVLCNQI